MFYLLNMCVYMCVSDIVEGTGRRADGGGVQIGSDAV